MIQLAKQEPNWKQGLRDLSPSKKSALCKQVN